MKLHFYLLFFALFFTACQSEPEQQEATTQQPTTTAPEPQAAPQDDPTLSVGEIVPKPEASLPAAAAQHCFRSDLNGDILEMDITIEGRKVKGDFNRLPKEKDAAHGQLLGIMRGNLIAAVWNHSIEGTSQRQRVTFKLEEDKVEVSYGKMVGHRDKMKLNVIDGVEFTEHIDKVDCD